MTDPILVSVKEAAHMLAIAPQAMYALCDNGSVDSRYQGRRRYVSVASLHEYANALPTEPDTKDEAS